ncbi:MAG: tetratricopeptide repeat protein [Candidatus Thorarchaeota archaeon]
MKPLGTITMYYPFFESETRSVIETISNSSSSYREFVLNLASKASEEPVPLHLVYIAARHAWQLSEADTMQRIAEAHGENAIIRPWTFHQRIQSESEGEVAQIRESIEDAIAAKPEDWIVVQLPQVCEGFLGLLTELSGFVEDIGNILANNPDLECFKSGLHNVKCWLYVMDDDLKSAISEIELGLEIARKFDDRYRVMRLLIDLANLTKNSDVRSALGYLESAHLICTELETKHDESVILNEMGLASTILGEFDLAMECHLNSFRIEEHEGRSGYFAALNLSHAHRNLDDHLGALSWAESALQSAVPGEKIWSHLAMARSLSDLGTLDKAAHHLDVAKELSLRSGHETVLGQYYYVLGLYELATGVPETALQTLVQALDIYERQNILLYVVYCLLALTEAELAIARKNPSTADADSSGPWMSRLRKLAADHDLPGIMICHNLMKSEFQLLQGRADSARESLQDALAVQDSPGMKTLRKKVLSKIHLLEEA